MTARAEHRISRDMLHTGMWTLLGLMGMGLVLVPLLQPSIVWTALFFGWSNVMVAYMAYRMSRDMWRRSRQPTLEMTVAPPVVAYQYGSGGDETPRRREGTLPALEAPVEG